MPFVSTAGASATSLSRAAGGFWLGSMAYVLVALASAMTILAAALLALLTPFYLHPALDASRSAAYLRVTQEQAHRLSDLTVGELVFGPGTFAFAGPDGSPFYDPAEAAHMRDVRLVLFGFLAIAALSALLLVVAGARWGRQPSAWRSIGRGGAVLATAIAVAGVFALVAFDRAFELFHQVLFPGGNWAFDPSRERLVQLYPLPFWQLTSAVFGVLTIAGGLAVWWLAGRRARRLGVEQAGASPAAAVDSAGQSPRRITP
jgi:integral membrane protein (TIGR01906 family)